MSIGRIVVALSLTMTLAGCGATSDGQSPRPFEAFASRTPLPTALPSLALPHDLFVPPPAPSPSVDVDAVASREAPESLCNTQPPQAWLKRESYLVDPDLSREEKAARRKLHHEAIAYRTKHYGHVEGFGDPSLNRLEPKHYAKDGTFFGIPVRMNNRVLTAVACVEAALVTDCASTPYTPHVLDGLRTANTFHNDEVSNHLYGIALDVDFDTNPCCGCIARISDRPLCKKPVASPFERTALPRCWVDTFERFGFAWLGYDRLEDTMHFEFLGDPDRIVKKKS